MKLNTQDKQTLFDGTRLLVFIVVTTVLTAVLAITIGNLQFGASTTYRAVFSDATGVTQGNNIRIAGVKVGTVQEVEIIDRTQALVTFEVRKDVSVTGATNATIRYRNLIGQRYIQLSTDIGDTGELKPGATIPVQRTEPALDLTVLFNGFKPLFEALSPGDVNQLSSEILQVFQGQGSRLESLLGHTASVTQTLANRDQLISDLIDNLNAVLANIGEREDQLSSLIQNFRRLLSGLKQDRQAILSSLDQISLLAEETSGLARKIRPPLVRDIKGLRRVTRNLDNQRSELDRALQVMPVKLNKIGRTASYGSFFNFYLCSFNGRIDLPGGTRLTSLLPTELTFNVGSDRCDLG